MKKKQSFEEAFLELEAIVAKMDSGELNLDASLAAFEEAVNLVRFCTAELDRAEQRVRALTEAADGSITDVPFMGADDAN